MLQKDIAAIFRVRTSTRENRMSIKELADLGITPESVSQALKVKTKGWVCEEAGKILGFTVGDGDSGEMLVVAVLPEAEGPSPEVGGLRDADLSAPQAGEGQDVLL